MADSSPNVNNYFIGKGIVTFTPTGGSTYDVGNVPEFEFTPSVDTLEHFSSREGVKTKDLTVTLSKGGELRMVMEEMTANNLAMLLIGGVDDTDPDAPVVDIFSENAVSGVIRFYATNEIGPQWDMVLNKVDFLPSGSFSPISEEWGQMEVTGQVASVNGDFGTLTKRATAAVAPDNIIPASITGVAQVGEVLTGHVGTWRGASSFTYTWEADGTPIGGATSITYTPVIGQIGDLITFIAHAVNITGTSTSESAPTAAVIAA